MTNIKDVAKKAGVSTTTVSHVINETRFVSDELRQRVMDAMQSMDYHPNILARSLRSGKSKTIGLIVPDISNLFFAEIARKVEDRGLEYGYSVILCNTDDDHAKEAGYIDVLITKKVDGIIFISAGYEGENLYKLLNNKIPIVIADRSLGDVVTDVVLVDNWMGGYTATKYLLELGHRKIACISGPSSLTPSAQRVEGFHQALKDAAIEINYCLVIPGDFRSVGGEKAMNSLLECDKKPTAVFACNDMMALGAMRAINNRGLRVPEDISLVGFDDIPISQCVYPAITTVAQPIEELGSIVVKYLIERIEYKNSRRKGEEPDYRTTVLETKLVKRDSCSKVYEVSG